MIKLNHTRRWEKKLTDNKPSPLSGSQYPHPQVRPVGVLVELDHGAESLQSKDEEFKGGAERSPFLLFLPARILSRTPSFLESFFFCWTKALGELDHSLKQNGGSDGDGRSVSISSVAARHSGTPRRWQNYIIGDRTQCNRVGNREWVRACTWIRWTDIEVRQGPWPASELSIHWWCWFNSGKVRQVCLLSLLSSL